MSQNSLICRVKRFQLMISWPDHHSSKIVTEFFGSPESNVLVTVKRKTKCCAHCSAAVMDQSDLYKHFLEKFKRDAAPISEVPGDGKDTHLKWHPGHRILLWTEDSW